MSHFTAVKTKLKNMLYLMRALKDLGYVYEEAEQGQKLMVKGYQGQTTKAELVIKASKTYDIGVVQTDEGLQFVSDWWGVETTRGVTEEQFIKAVTQRYSYHMVVEECKKRGYTLAEEKQEEDQTIKLTLRSYG
ncbi:MAG: DUF1257 domain-containing protein [Myxococcales bacterium]|nr:DUF1257 domain-containing protein [Myxococcales bacterium]